MESMIFYTAVVLFIVIYGIIISEKINPTVTALIGAILMIVLGVLSQEQAIANIDFNTLGLLVGMMVIVGIAKHSGMFEFIAIWSAKVAKGKPVAIFFLQGFLVALLSAFLDNVTTVLLMVPVVFVIANNLKINPKPFLISTILLSNIGGTATLIGDPPNILIGSAVGISFNEFIIHLGPICLIIAAATLGLLYVFYKNVLVTDPENSKTIMNFDPGSAISDRPLLIKSLVILAIVMAGFFTHSITHIEGATLALGGAALMLLLTMKDPEHHLKDVEWTTIFFFIGLFVLVGGLVKVGAVDMLAQQLLHLTGGAQTATTIAVLWGSGIASALINNVPFIATMIPLIKTVGTLSGLNLQPLWWALAIGGDIGGNATIIGASANVVVRGMADKEGHKIGFGEYAKIAAPLTGVALLIATVYIYLRYLI